MDWDAQNIALYMDDESMNTAALSSMLNADGSSPFKQKGYMLVNLALGGNNGGSLSGSTFPVRYEVDYIRVFQKD
jgi:beta-glucanase (GH16 family)